MRRIRVSALLAALQPGALQPSVLQPVALIGAWLLIAAAAYALPADDSSSVVRVSVLPARTLAAPGEVVAIAVILDHDRRWHTQAGGPDTEPDSIPTTVSVTTTDPRLHPRTDSVQWPDAERKPLQWAGPGASVAVYSGRTIIHVPIEIRPDADPGTASFTVTVSYQACDDRVCLTPVTAQSFPLQLAVTGAGAGAGAAASSGAANPEFFVSYRPVPAQLEPVAADAAIPMWVHVAGAVLLIAGGVLLGCAGMLGPQLVLLLRLAGVLLAVIAVLLWVGFGFSGS